MQDLEYAYRASLGDTRLAEPQVWLAAGAPADVAARLTAQGLTVTGSSDASGQRATLDRAAPAVALGFLPLAVGGAAALPGRRGAVAFRGPFRGPAHRRRFTRRPRRPGGRGQPGGRVQN